MGLRLIGRTLAYLQLFGFQLDLRSSSLMELSQELARFSNDLRGLFRCPTCLNDFPVGGNSHSKEHERITEEHIIPQSVGGRLTTFLCKGCNSIFGARQTRWLGEWIDLNEGKAPFPINPKKQKAKLKANGLVSNGSLRLAEDGAIEFISDRRRSNPKHHDELWKAPKPAEISVSFSMPVFQNEHALRIGYLTAAYCLWFKSFGYSWVLQRALDGVRAQILNPEQDIVSWNYLIEMHTREIENPSVGLIKLEDQIFPFAHIYDHIVLLPSAKEPRPKGVASRVSVKFMNMEPIVEQRFRHRCVGPSSFVCDGREIISPDFFLTTTLPAEVIRRTVWI